jgi:hypothetical protein
VPITAEGSGSIGFVVYSSTGLSDAEATSYLLDATAPAIAARVEGTIGGAGYYVASPVRAHAEASDAASGIASIDYSLDGGANWSRYDAPVQFTSDGAHGIRLRACDIAGHCAETPTQAFAIDTTLPTLSLTAEGTLGNLEWYRSELKLAYQASDSGSGLASLACSVNGAPQADCAAIVLGDGIYGLDAQACDLAGGCAADARSFKVDGTTPLIELDVSGVPGNSGIYTSNITVSARGTDGGSGLLSLEYSQDGGAWVRYIDPLPYGEGQRSLSFRAVDAAGNLTLTPLQVYWVDTTAPAIELPEGWKAGETVRYDLQDPPSSTGQAGSGLAGVRIVIEDEDERYDKVVYQEALTGDKFRDQIYWDGRFADGTLAPAGEYPLTVIAWDGAGNESRAGASLTVANKLLTLLLPASTRQAVAATAEALPAAPQPAATAPSHGGTRGQAAEASVVHSQAQG